MKGQTRISSILFIIKHTTGKCCRTAFTSMDTVQDFIHRVKSYNHYWLRNKQHHRKVQLKSFNLNSHTLGFHPQTQKLGPPLTAQQTAPQESTVLKLSFEWSHFRISSTDSKVRTPLFTINKHHAQVPLSNFYLHAGQSLSADFKVLVTLNDCF